MIFSLYKSKSPESNSEKHVSPPCCLYSTVPAALGYSSVFPPCHTFVIRTRYMLEEMEKANQNLYLSTYWINLTSAWMLSNTTEQDHNSSPCEHLPSGLLWMERYCKFWISHLGNCSFCTLHVLPMINPFAPYVFRGKNMILCPHFLPTRGQRNII